MAVRVHDRPAAASEVAAIEHARISVDHHDGPPPTVTHRSPCRPRPSGSDATRSGGRGRSRRPPSSDVPRRDDFVPPSSG
jgi:hypothetical protein